MKIRTKIGVLGLSLVMMTPLVACGTSPPAATAAEVEAAVKGAEAELAQAEATRPSARKTGQVYASLP